MLFTVAGAFMYVENRRLVEVFPDSVTKVWREWELRAMILLSLSLQIVLVLLGNRRKYMARTWIRIIIWSAYLMADWVATVALGIISRNSQDNCNAPGVDEEASNELMSFWAPFLLLHLGGPDTITAYSLEDNELWLRHLLGLVVQSGVALYIFLLAWPGSSWLPILSIPMLEVGLIKYGERTWALRSANSEHLRDSMLTPPDPGPNYAKFMEELTLKKAEGYYVDAIKGPEDPVPTDDSYPEIEEQLIIKVYDLFQTFKRLFVDLILTFHDLGSSKSFFQNLTSERAFHVVEVELGFAYDILYTKAPVVYTALGCLFRFISISLTLAVLVAFIGLSEKSKYHRIDLIITYLLLVGAVLLEIYAVIVMLYSYWTVHWLSKHKRTRRLLSRPCLRQFNKHMWSNSIAQYNLLSICLEDQKPAAVCLGIQRLLQIDKFREKHCYKTYSNVSKELKDLIFKQLVISTGNGSQESPRTLCAHRGSFVFKEYNDPNVEDYRYPQVEFDQSILILHIATDLCFYLDGGEKSETVSSDCKESKHISDYMLYLLVMCPFLLPIGIGLIRFRDTCAEAREFFKEKDTGELKAWEKLLRVNTEVLPIKVKGDRSKSVLFDACRLAQWLRRREDRWKIVSEGWVLMLAYAASHCRGQHHAQQLRKGGELLTHVWLLMAHLGITEQVKINEGHARAKLTAK